MLTSPRERSCTEVLDLLWSLRTVQQRIILRYSLLTRQAGSVSSLQSLSRDAVLLILSTNNSQERLVTPLVDRLEGEITRRARELLLAFYSERWRISLLFWTNNQLSRYIQASLTLVESYKNRNKDIFSFSMAVLVLYWNFESVHLIFISMTKEKRI